MRHVFLAAVALVAASQAPAQQAKPVTRSEFLNNVMARFNVIDANHDGKITRDEIIAAQQRDLRQANAKLRQSLEAKFRQLDTNHDGKLSLEEFLAAAPPVRSAQTPDQILQQLDANHDGKISLDEFRAPQLAAFNEADTNHDGIVSPAEAQAYARAHGQTVTIAAPPR